MFMRLTDLYYKMEYQYQHFLGQGQSNYKELIEILTDSSTHLGYLVFTSPLFFFHGFSHGQSSYWTAKSSFLFLTSDQIWADPNITQRMDFWTMIFYNLK